jgi:putative endonuclease
MAGSEKAWFCYMLRCSDGSLYVGAARDPVQRVKRHNQGLGAKHTAMRRPVILVSQEEHTSERAARGREAELKGWRREKKLELISKGLNSIHPSP